MYAKTERAMYVIKNWKRVWETHIVCKSGEGDVCDQKLEAGMAWEQGYIERTIWINRIVLERIFSKR